MLQSEFQTAAYITATVLFILSLGGLSNQESAKRSVWYGIVGMAIAVFVTIFGPEVEIGATLVVVLVNIVLDLSYAWLNPKVRPE